MFKGQRETPKSISNNTIALGCLPDSEGKTILLKTSPTLGTTLGRINIELSWKFLPWEMTLTLPEASSKLPRKKSMQYSYLPVKTMNYNNGQIVKLSKIVQWWHFHLEITNSCIIGLTMCLIGGNSPWYLKPSQQSMVREIINWREESIAYSLLNYHHF